MKPRDYAVALVVPIAVVAILAFPAYERMQGYSLDALFWLRNLLAPPHVEPAQSPTVVVAIDEQTYRTQPFEGVPKVFWTRQIADVIDALVDGGVAVIGFDLILSTSVEPFIEGYDRKLRIALKRAADQNKVILGATTLGQRPIRPLDVYRLIVRGRNIRSLNVITDVDGVIRYVPLLFRQAPGNAFGSGAQTETESDGRLVPSMSLTLASRLLGVEPRVEDTGAIALDDYRVPAKVDRHMSVDIAGNQMALANDMVVDLYAGPSSIPTFSLADLYLCATAGKKEFFRKHFEGKAVMLGTVLDVEDRKLTSVRFAQRGPGPRAPEICIDHIGSDERSKVEPWQRHLIPGIYLHAAAINNMVLGEVLRPLSKSVHIAITVALALAMAFCAMTTTSLRSGIAFVVGTGAWTGAATATFMIGWVLPLFHPIVAGAITLAALLGYRFTVTDRTQRHIRKAFGRILSPSLVERMVELNQMPTQGGELREITVWISDLENYTTISEVLPPTELVDLLNEVYTAMSDTIEEHDGFVAQFVGDAVVAAFGVPLEDPNHARHGIEAAMACCNQVTNLRDRLDLPQGLNLRIRVGVSTGKLLVGYIGSKRRLSYSIVGDDINLASRLEGVNKIYGSTILVNEVTRNLCASDIAFREIDKVRVKGRDTPVRIFEPLGKREGIDEEQQRRVQTFADGLAAFRKRCFEESASLFDSLAEHDLVSRKFAERARDMAENPPSADWDGVNTLLTK